MLRSPITAAARSMSLRLSTLPVGFCGELRMISLVLGVISRYFVHGHGEGALFAQVNGNRRAAGVTDHRFVDGKARVGVKDLVALVDEGEHDIEDDGLAAGDNAHLLGRDGDAVRAADGRGDGLAQLGQTGRGDVVRPSAA